MLAGRASQPPRRATLCACSRVAPGRRVASRHGCGSRDRQRHRAGSPGRIERRGGGRPDRRGRGSGGGGWGGGDDRRAGRARDARLRRRPHPPSQRRSRVERGAPLPARDRDRGPGGDPGHADAHPDDPWVLGRGWLYAAFPGGMPTAAQLDDVVPDRPAWMGCFDGHTGWANTLAMRMAGIDRETPDPPAGLIVRGADGAATGAFKEGAQALIDAVVPQPTEDEDRASVRRAIGGLHAAGITAVQDAWLDPGELAFWGRVHDAGELALRFRGALIMEPEQTFEAWRARLDAYEAQAFPLRGGAHLDAGNPQGLCRRRRRRTDGRGARPVRGRHEHRAPGLDTRDAGRVRGRGRPAGLAGRAPRDRRPGRPDGARRVRAGGRLERAVDRGSPRTWRRAGHPRPAPPGGAHRDDRRRGRAAVRAAGRRRLDAAVPRRPDAGTDRAVGGEHRGSGAQRVVVAADP